MTYIEDIRNKRKRQQKVALILILPILALFIPVYFYKSIPAAVVFITLLISLPIYRLSLSIKCPECQNDLQKTVEKNLNISYCPFCGLNLNQKKTEES